MNMLTPHRRNPSRRRQAPKRFEEEKFVSGRVDQYTRGYDGWQSKKSYRAQRENAENYYHTNNGGKFSTVKWNTRGKYSVQLRDFPESLLEIASIWRDLDMVLPSAIISHIGSFLDISKTDQDLLVVDDEFIAADESEDESIEDSEEEEFESCSDTDEEDYDSDCSYYSDDD